MAAVCQVPEQTGQKVAIGARSRLAPLEGEFSYSKSTAERQGPGQISRSVHRMKDLLVRPGLGLVPNHAPPLPAGFLTSFVGARSDGALWAASLK